MHREHAYTALRRRAVTGEVPALRRILRYHQLRVRFVPRSEAMPPGTGGHPKQETCNG